MIHSQSRDELVVKTGDSANGNGNHRRFASIRINQSGQILLKSGDITGSSMGSVDSNGAFLFSNGYSEEIFREGDVLSGVETIGAMGFVQFNDQGQVICRLRVDNTGLPITYGIFSFQDSSFLEHSRTGDMLPDGKFIVHPEFSGVDVQNSAGDIVYHALLSDSIGSPATTQAIFFNDNRNEIVRMGDAAPSNGLFGRFSDVNINDRSEILFKSRQMTSTAGGLLDDSGLFIANRAGIVRTVVRKGDAAGSNGQFELFATQVFNNRSQVVFTSHLRNTSGGSSDNTGLFFANGASVSEIVREEDSAFGDGFFALIDELNLNDQQQIAFRANLHASSRGSENNQGIYFHNGSRLVEIAREYDLAPTDGRFGSFSGLQMNNRGQMLFRSTEMTDTTNGPLDDWGIFIADQFEIVEVARTGVLLTSGLRASEFREMRINDKGQVAYMVNDQFGHQEVHRWTPDLHLRGVDDGYWDTNTRWTLSIRPDDVHDVYIDPVASLTLQGPGVDTQVRTLTVGGNTGFATLELQGGSILQSGFTTIANKGILTGDGNLIGDIQIEAGGALVADNIDLLGGFIQNRGVIRGNGYVSGGIVNELGGQIRANFGDELRLDGQSQLGGLQNLGRIEVIEGELNVMGGIVNHSSSGLITGRESIMRWDHLENHGSLGISFGTSDVFGDIDNQSTGIISISGGANVTFYEDIHSKWRDADCIDRWLGQHRGRLWRILGHRWLFRRWKLVRPGRSSSGCFTSQRSDGR